MVSLSLEEEEEEERQHTEGGGAGEEQPVGEPAAKEGLAGNTGGWCVESVDLMSPWQ